MVTSLSEYISSVPAGRVIIDRLFDNISGWSLIDWIQNLEMYPLEFFDPAIMSLKVTNQFYLPLDDSTSQSQTKNWIDLNVKEFKGMLQIKRQQSILAITQSPFSVEPYTGYPLKFDLYLADVTLPEETDREVKYVYTGFPYTKNKYIFKPSLLSNDSEAYEIQEDVEQYILLAHSTEVDENFTLYMCKVQGEEQSRPRRKNWVLESSRDPYPQQMFVICCHWAFEEEKVYLHNIAYFVVEKQCKFIKQPELSGKGHTFVSSEQYMPELQSNSVMSISYKQAQYIATFEWYYQI